MQGAEKKFVMLMFSLSREKILIVNSPVSSTDLNESVENLLILHSSEFYEGTQIFLNSFLRSIGISDTEPVDTSHLLLRSHFCNSIGNEDEIEIIAKIQYYPRIPFFGYLCFDFWLRLLFWMFWILRLVFYECLNPETHHLCF